MDFLVTAAVGLFAPSIVSASVFGTNTLTNQINEHMAKFSGVVFEGIIH